MVVDRAHHQVVVAAALRVTEIVGIIQSFCCTEFLLRPVLACRSATLLEAQVIRGAPRVIEKLLFIPIFRRVYSCSALHGTLIRLLSTSSPLQ